VATDFCYIEVLRKRNERKKIKLNFMDTISIMKSQKLFSWYILHKENKFGNHKRVLAPTGGCFTKEKAGSG
jgi:hypothetical protein